MLSILKRNNWLIVKIMVFITIVIPVVITAYELIILGRTSVVFLGDYPSVVGIVVVIYYAILFAIGILWIIIQLKALMKLKNEKTKNELLYLQSQVNPHFFFNMLNNLYGLIDKDAERSKSLVLKLSDLMRYSIYEGGKHFVPLEEEVDYLKNYIELHRMRYHKNIDIQFETNIEDGLLMVRPLLFIILLENAFKHGVENLRENACIHINLTARNRTIVFEIENNFDESQRSDNGGIGLINLKRRLKLAYPKNHKLIFANHNSIYKVYLQLQQ